jgi:hypothetical protein
MRLLDIAIAAFITASLATAALAAVLSSPAQAKDVTLVLSDLEQAGLSQVLDRAIQAGPELGAAERARLPVYFLDKLRAAIAEANKPPAPPAPPPAPPSAPAPPPASP